ncbi:MAG TPA: hypothetical protein VD838_04590 [Anaeromyxobacteraceae bacterium]|nr:hypothetical protein [Anaeromyxobacteraceae bacterium]
MAEARVERARIPEARVEREHAESDGLVRAGVVTGLLAGTLMLAWAMAGAALADLPATRPLAATAATFGGDAATIGPGGILAGALIWAGVSVALALLFAMFVPADFPFGSAAPIGVGYAFAVLAVMAGAVLPRVNPDMRRAFAESGGAWVLAFTVFGVSLGLLPAIRRRLASGRAPARPRD